MKIVTGIYGGSFNPIHNGHTTLGKALVKQGLVDELWFLVSPQNPFKVDDKLLRDKERLRLTRLAIKGRAHLAVCDSEMKLPRPSYMVITLEHLREKYPEREFVLVIGADNWERFPQWYHHDEILQKHRVIIYPRPGYELSNVPANILIANTPLLDISSTVIREQIKAGTYKGEDLAPAVWKEIKKKGYYQ